MSRTPPIKVYDSEGDYQAATKDATLAAAVVSLLGEGATVRYGHRTIIWREGKESIWAGESYDSAAETMHSRIAIQRAVAPRTSR